MTCGVRHPVYRKVFCERLTKCKNGIQHTGRVRRYWIEWPSFQATRSWTFWEMIQKLTDRVKIRQRRDDEGRHKRGLKRTRRFRD